MTRSIPLLPYNLGSAYLVHTMIMEVTCQPGSCHLTLTSFSLYLFRIWCFRLLHWASKEIDPVGVDYVLQKLGFTHARVTIPKWMQRGFMDPLDKFLSILIEYLITVLREKPKEPTEGES